MCSLNSQLCSVQSLARLGRRGNKRNDSAEIFFQSLCVCVCVCVGGHGEQFQHGHGRPLSDVIDPAFPLPNAALPIFQGALKDNFGCRGA